MLSGNEVPRSEDLTLRSEEDGATPEELAEMEYYENEVKLRDVRIFASEINSFLF